MAIFEAHSEFNTSIKSHASLFETLTDNFIPESRLPSKHGSGPNGYLNIGATALRRFQECKLLCPVCRNDLVRACNLLLEGLTEGKPSAPFIDPGEAQKIHHESTIAARISQSAEKMRSASRFAPRGPFERNISPQSMYERMIAAEQKKTKIQNEQPQKVSPQEFITVAEAGQELKISQTTAYRLVKKLSDEDKKYANQLEESGVILVKREAFAKQAKPISRRRRNGKNA